METLFEISDNVDKFMSRGSGWAVHDVISFDIEQVECRPLQGSCSLHRVSYIRQEGLQWTVEGFDNETEDKEEDMCFYLAVARHFVGPEGEKNAELLRTFIRDKLDTSTRVPVNLKSISAFEKDNKRLDLAIQVIFKDEDGEMFPIYISPNYLAKNQIVLMMTFVSKTDIKMHYAYLNEPEKMLAPRRKDKGGYHTDKVYFCFNCFSYMYRKLTFEEHVKWCHTKVGRIERMPGEDEVMSFQSEYKQQMVSLLLWM